MTRDSGCGVLHEQVTKAEKIGRMQKKGIGWLLYEVSSWFKLSSRTRSSRDSMKD